MIKKLIEYYCKELQESLTMGEKGKGGLNRTIPVRLEVNKTKLLSMPSSGKVHLLAELFVDNKCIFREVEYYNPTQDEKDIEYRTLKKMLLNIFMYGVMAANRDLEKYTESHVLTNL
jgi:hypothetical protein